MREQEKLLALAMSIKLRDRSDEMDLEQLKEAVKELGNFQIFSYRQISAIAKNNISHSTIGRLVVKPQRTGGKLNPQDLEKIRDIIFQRSLGVIDWDKVSSVLRNGTSADMLVKLTGIPKTTMHRKAFVGPVF